MLNLLQPSNDLNTASIVSLRFIRECAEQRLLGRWKWHLCKTIISVPLRNIFVAVKSLIAKNSGIHVSLLFLWNWQNMFFFVKRYFLAFCLLRIDWFKQILNVLSGERAFVFFCVCKIVHDTAELSIFQDSKVWYSRTFSTMGSLLVMKNFVRTLSHVISKFL